MVEMYYLFFANLQNKKWKVTDDKCTYLFLCLFWRQNCGCVIYLFFLWLCKIFGFLWLCNIFVFLWLCSIFGFYCSSFKNFIYHFYHSLSLSSFLPLPFPLKFMTSLILSYVPMYTQKYTVLCLLALLICICG